LAAGILICTGAIIGQIVTTSRAGFLVSKLILGFGLGFYLTLGPLMCSEITPVVLRGISTAGVNLGIALGQLISNSVIKGFGERTDRWAYRGPFAVQLFFAAFLAAGLVFAPESPWYLVRVGKVEKARRSLQGLYGKEIDISAKLANIETTVQEESTKKVPSFVDCFRGSNLLRTGISTGVFACQHFVGIIFVLGYSTYFFQLAGLDTSKSFDLGAGVTACGVLGNFCSWFVVNSYGRRKIFLFGMFALTGLLLLIGIMDVVPSSSAKWVQASATVIYAFVYFLTIGAMAFVILGEASSAQLRARTTALATATQAIFGIAMNFAIPYMVNPDAGNLKGKVGFIFGGLAAIASLGSFFYVPELKGRTFGEIDTMFFNRVPPRKMGNYQIVGEL
jgi:sugar porter (SP) family MFS transporter